MSLFDRFKPRPVKLSPEQARRLAAIAPFAQLGSTPLELQAWAVVDVEATGLHPQKDQLLAIGAVGLEGQIIPLGQGFECTLAANWRKPGPSVLIHGLSPSAVAEGTPPAEALLGFLEWLQGRPLLAFHASFDQGMLSRAIKLTLGLQWEAPFIDLAQVAPLLCPELATHNHSLDDWAGQFGLQTGERHNASADALLTAELALMLFSRARRQGLATPMALLEALARWHRLQHQPRF